MTFLELYGSGLDIQLASADTQLFTTARRKQAIRDAELAFIRETGCTRKYGSISIVDGTAEYSVATFTDYLWFADTERSSIRVKDADGNVRYIQGDDLKFVTPGWLDTFNPSWREMDAGTPTHQYLRVNGGVRYLGCWPAPDVGAGETWSWVVPYVAKPDTLTDDTDVPFSFSNVELPGLEPFHQALVHYAAAQLEPLRKNYDAVKYQMGIFTGFVRRYLGIRADEQPGQIQLAHSYLGSRSYGEDPRR